jgi:hypothetical protein
MWELHAAGGARAPHPTHPLAPAHLVPLEVGVQHEAQARVRVLVHQARHLGLWQRGGAGVGAAPAGGGRAQGREGGSRQPAEKSASAGRAALHHRRQGLLPLLLAGPPRTSLSSMLRTHCRRLGGSEAMYGRVIASYCAGVSATYTRADGRAG